MKLKLENGEIKEYKTVCTEYWGDGYTNYDTKCGIRWNSTSSKPESSLVDGCDHLDCAIYASKYDNFKGKHISIIAVTFAVVSFLMDWCDPGELIFLVFILPT